MRYHNIREEELKLKVTADYFWLHDCTRIIGNVDFCVQAHQATPGLFERESLLWAEAKTGSSNIYHSLTQLVLTIGKARTFDRHLPPPFLGAFDGEKVAFVPYADLSDLFYLNDFNWNVTPSNYDTREFGLVLGKVRAVLEKEALLFRFGADDKELRRFISQNLAESRRGVEKTRIDKNNFMVVYNKWCATVKPTIRVDWEKAKKVGIIDGYFYLADLLSEDNNSLRDKLFVLLRHDHYELDRHPTEAGLFTSSTATFSDRQVAHTQFWNRYHRPPKQEYWDYIVSRQDLLVPQDVRERKGSYFTPQPWVALSQQYLTQTLGENWQDEYTVWDCAAGTGNLLAGLTNKYNVWASTLDRADVEVMHDRIQNGTNLLDSHVFQFDFLNDNFDKLPAPLHEIINDEEKRKKLVVYINPPYAEAGDTKQRTGSGKNKDNVSNLTAIHKQYANEISDYAKRELFVQFFARIYFQLPGCILAEFSTLKILQAPYFSEFRQFFRPELKSLFVMPADTFDNVKGHFPIGFFIWDTKSKATFDKISATVFSHNYERAGEKTFIAYSKKDKNLNDWLRPTWKGQTNGIGFITCNSNDFQNSTGVFIATAKKNTTSTYYKPIGAGNILQSAIYLAVRHCIEATWLNDRDQFLYPADSWKTDLEFQNDCLAFTLFHGQNRISAAEGANHWIPFTEAQVGAQEKFASNFMSRYLAGKAGGAAPAAAPATVQTSFLPAAAPAPTTPVRFSSTAQAVYDAGLHLWHYYHAQPQANVNASLYDIRAHFQGRDAAGRMRPKSLDAGYTAYIATLRTALKALAAQLAPKLYEHGFLK